MLHFFFFLNEIMYLINPFIILVMLLSALCPLSCLFFRLERKTHSSAEQFPALKTYYALYGVFFKNTCYCALCGLCFLKYMLCVFAFYIVLVGFFTLMLVVLIYNYF